MSIYLMVTAELYVMQIRPKLYAWPFSNPTRIATQNCTPQSTINIIEHKYETPSKLV
mgnify:CR=1 FL=1